MKLVQSAISLHASWIGIGFLGSEIAVAVWTKRRKNVI
jgi:hypothetical protein